MKEMLSIYNDNLEEIGVKPRDEIHKRGLKHKVVQCWIIEQNKEEMQIYFQQRSFNKSDFPGMYDIACAGHIDSGEEAKNAMIRELEEEIGLKINESDLRYIGRKFENLEKNGFLDNEICEMYILQVNRNTIFTMGEEVEDIVKVPLKEYEKWINGKLKVLIAESINNNKKVEIYDKNICPNIKVYNEQIFHYILSCG